MFDDKILSQKGDRKMIKKIISVLLSFLLLTSHLYPIAIYAYEQIVDDIEIIEQDEAYNIEDDFYHYVEEKTKLPEIDTSLEDEDETEEYVEAEVEIEEVEEVEIESYIASTMNHVLEIMVEDAYVSRLGNGIYRINQFQVFTIPYEEIDMPANQWNNNDGVDLTMSMFDTLNLLIRMNDVREIIVDESLDREHTEIHWSHYEHLFSVLHDWGWGAWYTTSIIRHEDLTIRSSGEPVAISHTFAITSSGNLTLIDVYSEAVEFRKLNSASSSRTTFKFISNGIHVDHDIDLQIDGLFIFEGSITAPRFEVVSETMQINGNINIIADEIEYGSWGWRRQFPLNLRSDLDLILNGNININLERFHEATWNFPYMPINAGTTLTLNGNINISFNEYIQDDQWYHWGEPEPSPIQQVSPIYIWVGESLNINGDFITSDGRVFPNYKIFGAGNIEVSDGYSRNANFLIHCFGFNYTAECADFGEINISGGTLVNPSFLNYAFDMETWEIVPTYNITNMTGGTIYGHQPYFSVWGWGESAPLDPEDIIGITLHNDNFIGNDEWCSVYAQWSEGYYNWCLNDEVLRIESMTGGTIRPLWMYNNQSEQDLHVVVTDMSGGLIQNVYTEFTTMNDGTIDNRGLSHNQTFFEENNNNCTLLAGRGSEELCFYSSVLMNDAQMNGGSIYGASIQFIGDVEMTGGTIAYATSGALFGTSEESHFLLTDGTVRNNSSRFGGAVHLLGGTRFTINGGTIRDNHAEIGGAFYVNPTTLQEHGRLNTSKIATLIINDGTFANNTAEQGAVVAIRDFVNGESVVYDFETENPQLATSSVIINGGNFLENEAEQGGVLYAYRGYDSLTYDVAYSDRIWTWVDYEEYVEYCLTYGHYYEYDGYNCLEAYEEWTLEDYISTYDFCLDWDDMNWNWWGWERYQSFNDCMEQTFNSSSSFTYHYETYLVPRTCWGYIDEERVELDCELLPILTINGGNFENNEAEQGGALFLSQGLANVHYGRFASNHALHGGAIFVNEYSHLLRLTFVSNHTGSPIFYNNNAELGGAIYITDGSILIYNTLFEENNAINGGAVYIGEFRENLSVIIEASNFDRNEAQNDGGAIYIADQANNHVATVEVRDVMFDYNRAIDGMGGAIHVNDWNRHQTRALTVEDYASLIVNDNTHFTNNMAYHRPSHSPINPDITSILSHNSTLFDTAINNFDISFYYYLPISPGIVIDVELDRETNVTFDENNPNQDYTIQGDNPNDSGNIYVVFPPLTEEEHIIVNLPNDNWSYSFERDEDGYLIVIITPPLNVDGMTPELPICPDADGCPELDGMMPELPICPEAEGCPEEDDLDWGNIIPQPMPEVDPVQPDGENDNDGSRNDSGSDNLPQTGTIVVGTAVLGISLATVGALVASKKKKKKKQ